MARAAHCTQEMPHAHQPWCEDQEVILGLVGAASASICYGTATVLQAVGVRRAASLPAGHSLRRRLWAGRLFAAGLMLDGAGFLASLAALRTLPLFLVQSAIASSVAVTVVLAVTFLGAQLRTSEVLALAVIGVGLVALAASAADGQPVTLTSGQGWLLLSGVLPLALLTWLGVCDLPAWAPRAARSPGAVLALGAGLGFSGVGVAARVIVVPHPWWRAVRDPVLWALLGYSALAFLCYAIALTVAAITVVAAVTFGVETVLPAAVGLLLLGDRVRPGLGVLALVGFVATVGGCLALAGRSEISDVTST